MTYVRLLGHRSTEGQSLRALSQGVVMDTAPEAPLQCVQCLVRCVKEGACRGRAVPCCDSRVASRSLAGRQTATTWAGGSSTNKRVKEVGDLSPQANAMLPHVPHLLCLDQAGRVLVIRPLAAPLPSHSVEHHPRRLLLSVQGTGAARAMPWHEGRARHGRVPKGRGWTRYEADA